jgi:predicted metal-dependent enzyme (double-stranded beta helix superfamily)
MSVVPRISTTAELIGMLDGAMSAQDSEGRCQNVKRVLECAIGPGADFVHQRFLAPAPERYARRLMHRDPAGRYTLLAMVWGVGQGTPLHDHAGMWCVECVYRGRIRVTSYSPIGPDTAPVIRFRRETELLAGIGEAGALIPPFDFHTIENADATPSVTLHVYGGEMDWCYAFLPVDGGYRRERRSLAYTA